MAFINELAPTDVSTFVATSHHLPQLMEIFLIARARLSILLSTLLVAGPTLATTQYPAVDQLAQIRADENIRAQNSVTDLLNRRAEFGLDTDTSLTSAIVHTDDFGQTHAHVQQFYRGVKVWGGQAITHVDSNGAQLPVTSVLKAGIAVDTIPFLRADDALALAHQDLSPKGPYATKPTAELVVFPIMKQVHVRTGSDATAYERQVVRYALAYHVHTDLQNGADETKQIDYMMDASTGAILQKWSSLQTTAVTGVGNSQYSGTVNLNTNSAGGGYELRDMTRGSGGVFGNNAVTNLNHATDGTGALYSDTDNSWGDGANYVEGTSTTAANGQTAAVDAAYGLQATWDMYKNVLGRNGIDNRGSATYMRVHYGNGYDNAFWDPSCFCMTFGDGTVDATLTPLDVAGHEMSHGVLESSVAYVINHYYDEPGGLNESNSDIFGTMVEFYARGGGLAAHATTIPETGGNWTILEQASARPLRFMYKPSLDGRSPDAWYEGIGTDPNLAGSSGPGDPHYVSGPGNRMFYFLAQGAMASGDTSTPLLPDGMTGIGNDHAARIHYRAITTYYVGTETYDQARDAHLSAAADLYGTSSPEYAAVQYAFHGINVGSGATPTFNPRSSDGYVGEAFADTLRAIEFGTHTFTWSATGLPPGIKLDATTGAYSGTPTQAGDYSVAYAVTDELGGRASAQFSFHVAAPVSVDPVAAKTSNLGSVTSGGPFTATGGNPFTDPNGNPTYQWSASGLPDGIFISVDGTYGGVPTKVGTYSVTVTARDLHVRVASRQFSWTVFQGVAINPVADRADDVGDTITGQFTAVGGTAPYSWSASGLPTGITLNPASGAYSGTLTQPSSQPSATVSVTDQNGITFTRTFNWNVDIKLTMVPAANRTDAVGSTVTGTFQGLNGALAYTFSATGLPPGITLSSWSGTYSGVLTQAGSFSVTGIVTDARGHTATTNFTWVVPFGVTRMSDLTNQVGDTVSGQFTATGGAAPYVWSATGLPPGIVLNATTGVFSGTLSGPEGDYSVSYTSTDHNGLKVTQSFSWNIGGGIITPPSGS